MCLCMELQQITEMSFEQAMKELEVIVRKLEVGEISLDESIKNYMRGNELKAHCQKTLNDAKLQVEKIIRSEGGAVVTEPFDA